jgi:hypothetical protein
MNKKVTKKQMVIIEYMKRYKDVEIKEEKNFRTFERWEIFHDGKHNWDKFESGHNQDGKSSYNIEICTECNKAKLFSVESYNLFEQGSVCLKICTCVSSEATVTWFEDGTNNRR